MKKSIIAFMVIFSIASLTFGKPAISYGYNYDYFWDFSGGLPPDFHFTSDLPGIIKLDDTGGNLRIYSSYQPYGGVNGAGVGTNFTLGGDFYVSVHYKLNQLYNGTQAHFFAGGNMLRSYERDYNNYHVWLGYWYGTISTSDMEATMGLRRTGGTIEALVNGTPFCSYYWGTGDVYVSFNIQSNSYGGWSGGYLDITYDNLRVQCDAFPSGPPVPVPPSVWLLGSGLLGLVGWRRFRAG